MHEEVEALRAMLKDMKAKADRYEAALTSIAQGPLSEMDFDSNSLTANLPAETISAFASRVQKLAKAALE